MKTQLNRICSGLLLLSSLALATVANAQTDLDRLLEDARNLRAQEEALFDQRAAEWAAAPEAQRQTMLNEITAERDRLQTVTRAQAEEYAQNDIEINTQNTALRDRANELGLGEVFGLARQFAGDQATLFEQSLINAQFADEEPSRVEFLDQIASSNTIISTADLEKFWLELTREMTSQGQVAKFNGTIVAPNGDPTETTVTRIGPFLAMADGQFLAHLPA